MEICWQRREVNTYDVLNGPCSNNCLNNCETFERNLLKYTNDKTLQNQRQDPSKTCILDSFGEPCTSYVPAILWRVTGLFREQYDSGCGITCFLIPLWSALWSCVVLSWRNIRHLHLVTVLLFLAQFPTQLFSKGFVQTVVFCVRSASHTLLLLFRTQGTHHSLLMSIQLYNSNKLK